MFGLMFHSIPCGVRPLGQEGTIAARAGLACSSCLAQARSFPRPDILPVHQAFIRAWSLRFAGFPGRWNVSVGIFSFLIFVCDFISFGLFPGLSLVPSPASVRLVFVASVRPCSGLTGNVLRERSEFTVCLPRSRTQSTALLSQARSTPATGAFGSSGPLERTLKSSPFVFSSSLVSAQVVN